MRPRGEIRLALRQVFERAQQPLQWRPACEAAQVGFDAGFTTVRNMVRAGELRQVTRAAPHRYEIKRDHESTPVADLMAAMRSWAEFT